MSRAPGWAQAGAQQAQSWGSITKAGRPERVHGNGASLELRAARQGPARGGGSQALGTSQDFQSQAPWVSGQGPH